MSKTKVSGKLINTREVADLLGVTTQTILNWVKNGVLKPFKSANNTMYFSRKYINTFIDEIEDLSGLDNALEQYKSEIRHAIKERDEKLKLLRKEIAWCDGYALNRYVKTISSVSKRLVDIGEISLTDNEERVLQKLLSLEPLTDLCEEMGVTYTRINQIVKKLYVKLARVNLRSTAYDKLKEENARLRKQLLEATTHNEDISNADILGTPISKCNLSVRTDNVLSRIGIENIGDLAMWSEKDLLKNRNFGAKSLREVKLLLSKYNLELNRK